MRTLDPFYGVRPRGVTLARWLNRLLLVAEAGALVVGETHLSRYGCPSWTRWAVVAAFPFALSIVNSLLRRLWDIVVVAFYGTTDEHIIVRDILGKDDDDEIPWTSKRKTDTGTERGRAALKRLGQ